MTSGFFITGTDTAIGKTTCAVALIHWLVRQGLRVAAMKPVATGANPHPQGLRNDDALRLQAAANMPLPYDVLNPYCFAPAIAPHIAAQEAGIPIRIEHVCTLLRGIDADQFIVEGAGGWQVPLNEQHTMADLAQALNLPVILVVGMRLGCLNHALLSYNAIVESNVRCAGWIANHIDPHMTHAERNREFLVRHLGAPLLATIPFAPGSSVPEVVWNSSVLLAVY